MKHLSDYVKNLGGMHTSNANQPLDMKTASEDAILQYFRQLTIMHCDPRLTNQEKFYGGITNDIPSNLSRHNIKSYLGCVDVGTPERATDIEALLNSKLGVFIGKDGIESAGRGITDDSTIVYLADRAQDNFKD
jgi:hypothetical protein